MVTSIQPHLPIKHVSYQVAGGWTDTSHGPQLAHDLQLDGQSQPAPQELLLHTMADTHCSTAMFAGVGTDYLLPWRCFQLQTHLDKVLYSLL